MESTWNLVNFKQIEHIENIDFRKFREIFTKEFTYILENRYLEYKEIILIFEF